MATSKATKVGSALANAVGVPISDVVCTLDGDVVVLTVTGELHGLSPRNAARRRQRGLSAAMRAAEREGVDVSVTYAVQDAVSILEGSIAAAAALVLGGPPISLNFQIKRAGTVSVLLVVPIAEDQTQDKVQKVISPLLRSAGLQLERLSLVSDMREDIADGQLLRLVKKLSPCDAVGIVKYLRATNHSAVSTDSIHRRLDILRQKGLLTYLGDRCFALTMNGLGVVPTSRKRSSSDVERILALGRRRW